MRPCAETLKALGVPFCVRVLSAHRTRGEARSFALNARADGFGAIIAAAGKAAHLAGAMAANTTLPVIGVPVKSSTLDGLDALLSTVQMRQECRWPPWPSTGPRTPRCWPRRSSPWKIPTLRAASWPTARPPKQDPRKRRADQRRIRTGITGGHHGKDHLLYEGKAKKVYETNDPRPVDRRLQGRRHRLQRPEEGTIAGQGRDQQPRDQSPDEAPGEKRRSYALRGGAFPARDGGQARFHRAAGGHRAQHRRRVLWPSVWALPKARR